MAARVRRAADPVLGSDLGLETATIKFGTFSLDEDTGQLWHADSVRPLRAKSFAVLCELARRPGRVVTKEDLFRACWPATAVSQTVLRVCIREIRLALAK
jgi:DNA-binding winged helix-turn-helix (wHTH) protein